MSATPSVTRVLIVDDSGTARLALRRALEQPGSGIEVVGQATSGASALEQVAALKPDLVTMDVFLQGENGIDITANILERHPLPILIVTGADHKDPRTVFRALGVGALEVLAKPVGPEDARYREQCERLIGHVKSLARVPVYLRRKPRAAPKASTTTTGSMARPTRAQLEAPASVPQATAQVPIPLTTPRLVVIGASTGGPAALHTLLHALPRPFALPIVIVQHITEGFAEGMAQWLGDSTGHVLRVVDSPVTMQGGMVYLAGSQRHLHLRPGGVLEPVKGPPRRFNLPSIDEFFESVARLRGPGVIAALLTGMGDDGAAGLAALREVGALTIVQDPASCVVPSMPKNAIRLDGAAEILELEDIVKMLVRVSPTSVALPR